MDKNETWWTRLTAEEKADYEKDSSYLFLYVERLFKIRSRNTTIAREVRCGVYHFFSCCFILAVNPNLLRYGGFQPQQVAAATAITTGASCITSGLLSNLPFVLAPTTSSSLYFSLFLRNRNLTLNDGNFCVFLLGLLYFLCGIRTLALFLSNIVPFVMKVGICLGVGLLIALEALSEIGLVTQGDTTVLDIGEFDAAIYVAMVAFISIGLALHFRIRCSFLLGLSVGAGLYWLVMLIQQDGHMTLSSNDVIISPGDVSLSVGGFNSNTASRSSVYRLVFDLFIIGVILLNGLAHGLSDMAGLKRSDDSLPRGKWLYAACGLGTLLSSLLGAGPIMILPESAPGIKSGARTGLSSVVCGTLFLLSTIFCPLFANVPAAGTSPVLLMIGMMLFENAGKVNWSIVKEALPVFIMCVFIPFTYSIFNGVVFGFGMYVILLIITDEKFSRALARLSRICFRTCCCCGRRTCKRCIRRSKRRNRTTMARTGLLTDDSNCSGKGNFKSVDNDANSGYEALNVNSERMKDSGSDSNDDDDDSASDSLVDDNYFDYFNNFTSIGSQKLAFELNEISDVPYEEEDTVNDFTTSEVDSGSRQRKNRWLASQWWGNNRGISSTKYPNQFSDVKDRNYNDENLLNVFNKHKPYDQQKATGSIAPTRFTTIRRLRDALNSEDSNNDTSTTSPYRKVNAGAGALLVRSRSSETPDWVLD